MKLMSVNQVLEEQVWACEVAHWDCITASNLNGLNTLWHESGVGWSNGEAQPHVKDGVLAATAAALDALKPDSVEIELNRQSVHVVGDVGVAFFTIHARAIQANGTPFEIKERCTRTWLRDKGEWKIVAAMSAEIIDE